MNQPFLLSEEQEVEFNRMREAGLYIRSRPVCWFIHKLADVKGNDLPDSKPMQMSELINGKLERHGPHFCHTYLGLDFNSKEGHWIVCYSPFIGINPPGVQTYIHLSLREAVDNILDFFFGDPGRMLSPEVVQRL